MKKLAAILLLGLLTQSAFAQFIRGYDSGLQDIGRAHTYILRDNPGYLMSGSFSAGSSGSPLVIGLTNGLVTRTDHLGNFIWAEGIAITENTQFYSVAEERFDIQPVHYGVTGFVNDIQAPSLTQDAVFVALDKKGGVLSSYTYGGNNREDIFDIQNIKDEQGNAGFIMAGQTNSYQSQIPGASIFVVQTDIYGQLNKASVIGSQGTQSARRIIQTQDDGFAIIGFSSEGCTPSNTTGDVFIVKLKSDLSIQWDYLFSGFKSGYQSMSGTSIVEDSQGNLIITGNSQERISQERDVLLFKLDHSGNLIWSKVFGNRGLNEFGVDVVSGQINPNQEGYTVLAKDSPTKSFMFQTDVNGNLVRARNYKALRKVQGAIGFLETENLTYQPSTSTYTIAGSEVTPGSERDQYLAKTEFNLNANTFCEESTAIEQRDFTPCITSLSQQVFVNDFKKVETIVTELTMTEEICTRTSPRNSALPENEEAIEVFKAYPNPIIDKVTLQIPEEFKNGAIRMIDLRGKTVRNEALKGHQEKVLFISDLPVGLYLIQLISQKGRMISITVVTK